MKSFSGAMSRFGGLFRRYTLPAAALLMLTACDGLGQAMSAHTDVVARAAGRELRVEEAAQMLGGNPQIPADPEVVRALTDLWIDYALLATAVAEDSSLAALDMETFVGPVREQALVARLREQVLQVDTVIDDEELERRWATEGPGAEISARHILLRIPTDATDAQRDSVRSLAASLRERAVAGESFDSLAREYSQDPGSAVRGGDLGFFARGRMVQPFEEAAFAMQPGEISEPVESPFGYHVILVEDRRQPELGEEREQFRAFLAQQSVQEAEMAYIDSLTAEANVEIVSTGLDVVREIATRPERSLSGNQAEREVATHAAGELTAGEFSEFIRTQPAQVQSAFATASDDQLETAIQQLVQMELLLAEAEEQGITLTAEEEAEIRSQARASIDELVEATGFAEAARQQADPAALDAHVKALVEGVVSGEQPFIPLGLLGVSLRNSYTYEINDGAFPEVVSRLEAIRAQQPTPAIPGQAPPGAPGTPPAAGDSAAVSAPAPAAPAAPAAPPPPAEPAAPQGGSQ